VKPEYIPVLLSFATFLGTLGVVGVGLLYNNSRLTDLRAHMDVRMASMEARLELLTGKVMELSDRMVRVEERLGMK
jgi:hypothetical protein